MINRQGQARTAEQVNTLTSPNESKRARSGSVRQNPWIIRIGLTVIGAFVLLVQVAMDAGADVWRLLVVLPILFLVNIPIILRIFRRDSAKTRRWVIAAFCLRILVALAGYFITFELYGGADAETYHDAGMNVAEALRGMDPQGAIDAAASYRSPKVGQPITALAGTESVAFAAGVLYTFTGPSAPLAFILFGIAGFWGSVCFYQAFRVGVPAGNHHLYLLLLFFLPSLLYWSSTLGKEPLMMLSLGMAALAVACFLTRPKASALVIGFIGIVIGVAVRVHLVAILGLAAAAGYAVKPVPMRWRELRPVIKLLGLAFSAFAVVAVSMAARDFVGDAGIDIGSGFIAALADTAERTAIGGSEIEPVVVSTPADVPRAFFNVLFRPHLLEIANPFMALAGIEAAMLFALIATRFRSVWHSLRRSFSMPYVTVSLLFTCIFTILFSAFGNLGLLVRQRVQVLPFFLVLLLLEGRVRQSHRLDSSPSARD